MLAAEALDREPTNRAWADTSEIAGTGLNDIIDPNTGEVITEAQSVEQPNHHWGDGSREGHPHDGRHPHADPRSSHGGHFYAHGGYSIAPATVRLPALRRQRSELGQPLSTRLSCRSSAPKSRISRLPADSGDAAGLGRRRRRHRSGTTGSATSFAIHSMCRSGNSLTNPTAPGPDGIFGNADAPGHSESDRVLRV